MPDRCLADPSECLEDEQFVKITVPTTLTDSDSGPIWDMGFQRRRVIVTQDIVFRDMNLQGAVSDVDPIVFFFMFTNNSNLRFENCVFEHSCAGSDAMFFVEAMRLVCCLLLSQSRTVPCFVSYLAA